MRENIYAGVDVGGTGIKAAVVDTNTGQLLTERIKVLTPQPATPEAVAKSISELLQALRWDGPTGVGFPAIVKNQVAMSAGNIPQEWIGVNVSELLTATIGHKVTVANDADVAGVAEMKFSDIGRQGTTIFLTIGTGIGSAMFLNGELIPNTEFGHLFFRGTIAEKYCSNHIRKIENLSLNEWASRFREYTLHLNRLFSPDRYIIGGGISKKFDEFKDLIQTNVPVYRATHMNAAGVMGAALMAVNKDE